MNEDKYYHFAGCGFITLVVFLITGSVLIGAILAFAVGLGKEIYDEIYGTGFDLSDLAFDLAGIFIVSFILTI